MTAPHQMTGNNGVAAFLGEIAMKTIVSTLIALSVLAGVAAPASALDTSADGPRVPLTP